MVDSDPEALRRAYSALLQQLVNDRLEFADRIQELQEDREEQVGRLEARIEELHRELVEAHESHRVVVESRSFRYTRPLRGLAKALHRP